MGLIDQTAQGKAVKNDSNVFGRIYRSGVWSSSFLGLGLRKRLSKKKTIAAMIKMASIKIQVDLVECMINIIPTTSIATPYQKLIVL